MYSSSATINSGISSTALPVSYPPTATAIQSVSGASGFLTGKVVNIVDENSMYVDFTGSKLSGLNGTTLVLLSHPIVLRGMQNFQGKELSFNLLGHDILGRPVVDAYYNGVPISTILSRYWDIQNGYGYYGYNYGYYPMYYGYDYGDYYPRYYRYNYGYYPRYYGNYASFAYT